MKTLLIIVVLFLTACLCEEPATSIQDAGPACEFNTWQDDACVERFAQGEYDCEPACDGHWKFKPCYEVCPTEGQSDYTTSQLEYKWTYCYPSYQRCDARH